MLESTAHMPMCYNVTLSTAYTPLKLGHIPVLAKLFTCTYTSFVKEPGTSGRSLTKKG